MSILIRGMDKPTDCGVCPFEDFGYCNVKGERNTSENGIDADCPLIEIAEQTEPNVVMPKKCKGCDSASKIIEAYSRGYTDGADAVKKIAEQTEPTISKMEQVDKDINVRSKTENCSEKPNNCEHITEDGVTCAKYPACDDCPDNPLNKVKGSERLVKGKDEPQTDCPKSCPSIDICTKDATDCAWK